ncbi:MAG TPA: thiamine pyrophosphate-binding protein [Rhodospirillales bacterium]|nr:thiamine pyrophosphate-binding protein [Rhodospirillales bacterium]
MSKATSTTADVMAQYFRAAGISHIFGLPGGQNIEFMEAARKQGLEFVLARREGTAALMADAAGQLTGRPGVCMSTLGPGSTNLVNGVANALLDRSPMIAVSGQLGTRLESTFTHQKVDQLAIFTPISKWATKIGPDDAASVMRRALRLAVAERPGPVHLTLNANYAKAEATDTAVALPPMTASADWTQVAHSDSTADPVKRLQQAKRPIVLVGMSAMRGGAGPSLTAFAERLGCPVVTSPKGKGTLAEDHPYFAGTVDMACNKVIWEFLSTADLILAVGFDAVELIKPWQLDVPVIHIDTVANTDQVYPAEIELIGPIGAILDALADGSEAGAKWPEADIKAHRDAIRDLYYSGRQDGKLNPTDVVDVARAAFSKDTLITTDVGSHKLLIGQGWETYQPGGVMMSNGLSSMGFALPGAITASMLDRERKVVCFTGDGGLAMVHGELQLASEMGLGLVIVVFCDGSMNRIELKQMQLGYPSTGTKFKQSDLVGMAQAVGCDGERAETPKALEDVLARAANPGGLNRPLLVEASIDPTQYEVQF